jgi:ubiquinone/menaquinone biosynthesis C-methylase UbiE
MTYAPPDDSARTGPRIRSGGSNSPVGSQLSCRSPVPRLVWHLADFMRPLDFRRADECNRVIDWLDPGAGERVLDVGCGDGYYGHRIAGLGAQVDAIDANRDRVACASRRHPHPNVAYHHMTADALTFEDERFDKVVSICVLEHIQDDVRALSEMFRVLRRGGRLVLSCDSLSNAGITERCRRRHAVRYSVKRFYSRDSLYERLRVVGFSPRRSTFVLSSRMSLAFTHLTYIADDVGRLPGGWLVKYPMLALAGTLGLSVSRLTERLIPRTDEGLTIVAEAVRPAVTGPFPSDPAARGDARAAR